MNRKFVSKSNLVLSKILNSNNCLDILKDFIETILKVKIKNITLNNPKENKYYSSTTYYSMGIVEVRIQTEDEELEALKEKAKKLGIKNAHNMKKETLIAKIEEAKAGEGQNPEGE